jgi:hypothetical protein
MEENSCLCDILFRGLQIKRLMVLEVPKRTGPLDQLALWPLVYSGSLNRHPRSAQP